MNILFTRALVCLVAVTTLYPAPAGAQTRRAKPPAAAKPDAAAASYRGAVRDREIAAALSPIFVQGLGESPRFDYITRFDFDGDWKGDNNWKNSEDAKYPLLGYVYFDVKETETHYLVHFAAFHPRDYKGGNAKGAILSELMQEGARVGGKWDPTGLSQEAILAHENDMEGCLVVAEKRGDNPLEARVVAVETLAHNQFLKYAPEDAPREGVPAVSMKGQHARLYVEPKGHGIEALAADEGQKKDAVNGTVNYKFAGAAEDPEKRAGGPVGYDLVPLYTTIWPRARSVAPETFGEQFAYTSVGFQAFASGKESDRQVKVGALGTAFLGKVGGRNMARPPWGWFDNDEKDRPLGEWYFDPAAVIKRHFKPAGGFSLVYVHNPALGVFRNS